MVATMTERLQVFTCTSCGMMVEVLRGGTCAPTCCGEAMKALVENTVDAAREKHVPVVEITAAGVKVSVGSVAHPMEEKHFIEWIEIVADGQLHRQYLAPGQTPEAFFPIQATTVVAREHCNLHGLWKGEGL